MLKYVNYEVTFAEIPDEISLCFSISNCDGLCEGCHSPELRGDVGKILALDVLKLAVENYHYGITCICFLGEGRKDPNAKQEMFDIIDLIRTALPDIKIALYSGRPKIDYDYVPYLDYYKVGPYIAAYGPLNKKTTNQRLYKIQNKTELIDITNKFWIEDKQ